MIARSPVARVVAEDDLLVLGAELEDVDAVDGGRARGLIRYGGVGRHGVPLSVAPRGWVALWRATRGGVTHLAR